MRLLTTGLNPLDAARVLANQAHIVGRGGQALGLGFQGSAFSQLVLLHVLQHVFHAQQVGLQVGVGGASRGRGGAGIRFHTSCCTHFRRCAATNITWTVAAAALPSFAA